MSVLHLIKKFCYNKTYIKFYNMMKNKDEICKQINDCVLYKKNEDMIPYIEELYSYVCSEIDFCGYKKETINREKENCYRTKKVKSQNGEKGKEKVLVEKMLFKSELKSYNAEIDIISQDVLNLQLLKEKLEEGHLTPDLLTYCDKVLYRNRINKRVYLLGLVLVILLLAFAIITYVI